jgi:deoxyribonuclease-4
VHPDELRIGAHLPLGDGMVKAAERARAIGATTLQVFGDNPTAWRRRREPPGEQGAFRDCLAAYGIGPVAVHAAYLVNLAGPDPDFFARSVEVLVSDLRAAPGFGARFVNVHTGSHREAGVAAGTKRLADGVAATLAQVDEATDAPTGAAMLVLENSAGSGFGIGTTVEELAAIADAIAARGVPQPRLAFCLDTAHLWAAGHNLADPDITDRLLTTFDRLIGLDRLVMLHLNDSKSECGSRLDRHQHVGAGGIGERGTSHLLRHPLLRGKPWYVETPGMDEGYDAVNVERAKRLAAGVPLDPLPPGALDMRGSRAKMGPRPETDPRPQQGPA